MHFTILFVLLLVVVTSVSTQAQSYAVGADLSFLKSSEGGDQ